MFFVAKEKIGTTLGAQKEYAACTRRGIGFASEALQPQRSVWHYFWPIDMVEPSVRARFQRPEPQPVAGQDEDLAAGDGVAVPPHETTHVLWSQLVATGEVIGEPVISAYSGDGDWVSEAKAKFNAAQPAQ